MDKVIEFNCPKCKNKLIADVDIDALVNARINEILTKILMEVNKK